MFEDLRAYLDHLETRGQLLRVKEPVDVKYEIAAGVRKTSDIGGPALLFENVKGFPGWRVLGGLFATRRLVALGLGVAENELLERYLALEEKRIPPEIARTGPVKEIRWSGDQIDLARLPVVTHAGKDCGPYITIGVQVGKDPHTGVRNLSIHRMLVLGKDRLSLWAPPDHHLGRMILMAEEQGRGLEVATAIGVEPAIVIGSQAKVPYGIDEYHIAGGLRGAPVELVRCETIDVEVPARAEIVIEGVTVPGERVADGPYGEYPGCYSEAKQAPVLKVTAITMREQPIYQTALTGMPVTENHTLIEYANAAVVYREAKKIVPEVRAVHMTPGGTFRHHAVVSIKKRSQEEGRNLILALLALGIGLKQVTVVDDDIDVANPLEVEWALSTRMQPDRDIIVVPRIACSTLDPSVPAPRVTAAWGIDATAPLADRWRFEKVEIPGVDRVKYI
ncbi:MAG TPA: UbiD family decarboxylase [candidate division Zixibacteria bacterium]|nr:UbiD family decarboxylase [candidate division Zixibacteria bacterium]